MLMWLVCLLLYVVQSLSILQITFALCLLLNFCTIEYLVLHERFCMHKQLVIFHLIICFFYLLYCNTYNKINKSKITLVFLFITCFGKMEFCFYLCRNNFPATTLLTGLFAIAMPIGKEFDEHYTQLNT